MWRLRVAWTGSTVVGGGLSTFYSLDTSPGFPAAVRNYFQSLRDLFPIGTTITVPNNGDVIDATTGTLTGVWTDGGVPAPVTGNGAGVYALGVGAQTRWRTSGIVGGRRVVGSTFLVPMVALGFDSDGTLGAAPVTSITAAGNAYIAANPAALIWSRPKGPRVGTTHLITGVTVPDRPSWIVSRRR